MTDPPKLVEEKEGFKTGAVTRAADCNCLPGYIPFNTSQGGYTYICRSLADPTKRRKCY